MTDVKQSACMSSEGEPCTKENCRYWIDYPEDGNCALTAVKNNGAMTLDECAKRLGISLVRVSQIEKQAIRKLFKRIKSDFSIQK
tara:strand:- start:252 stop:506 length:255 start_codon:yes stop_codon:yes gene_type:complete